MQDSTEKIGERNTASQLCHMAEFIMMISPLMLLQLRIYYDDLLMLLQLRHMAEFVMMISPLYFNSAFAKIYIALDHDGGQEN